MIEATKEQIAICELENIIFGIKSGIYKVDRTNKETAAALIHHQPLLDGAIRREPEIISYEIILTESWASRIKEQSNPSQNKPPSASSTSTPGAQ